MTTGIVEGCWRRQNITTPPRLASKLLLQRIRDLNHHRFRILHSSVLACMECKILTLYAKPATCVDKGLYSLFTLLKRRNCLRCAKKSRRGLFGFVQWIKLSKKKPIPVEYKTTKITLVTTRSWSVHQKISNSPLSNCFGDSPCLTDLSPTKKTIRKEKKNYEKHFFRFLLGRLL